MTKASELHTDVYSLNFNVICLFQKWINIFCTNYNRLLRTWLLYIARTFSDAKSYEEGSFIAVSGSISGFVCRTNLELVEIKYQIQIFWIYFNISLIYYR